MSNKTGEASVKWPPLTQTPREKYFFKAINILNKQGGAGGRTLYKADNLGYALIYFRGGRWEVEWFDEALSI